MTAEVSAKVNASTVTLNFERAVLLREFELLAPQVDKIWLVDNASSHSLAAWVSGLPWAGKLELDQMLANLGLGAAQNAGIQLARAAGASDLLIHDQDREPMPGMVDRLLADS
jgi:rhamnosyltransferase